MVTLTARLLGLKAICGVVPILHAADTLLGRLRKGLAAEKSSLMCDPLTGTQGNRRRRVNWACHHRVTSAERL